MTSRQPRQNKHKAARPGKAASGYPAGLNNAIIMKNLTRGLLFLLICWFGNSVFSQDFHVYNDTARWYKISKITGNYYYGKKIGKWTEKSLPGIVYSESVYDSSGMPVGTWIHYFPDGKIRFSTEFSDHRPQKFSIFRFNRILAEITSLDHIADSTFQDLRAFEEDMYNHEQLMVYSYNQGMSDAFRDAATVNPYEEVYKITSILTEDKFSGFITIWSADKTKGAKCDYMNGIEFKTKYFYNKKKELVKQEEYQNSKITRVIVYKKNGEQQIKTY
jgi:antitoxin component YwqK of YwqJK toxin-antitoxin module